MVRTAKIATIEAHEVERIGTLPELDRQHIAHAISQTLHSFAQPS